MKFKLKTLKLTNYEENILITICLILIVFSCIALISIYRIYIYKLKFNGTLQSENNLNENIKEVIYDNNGKIESHFIDNNWNREVDINKIINVNKKEEFDNKINELLLFKYPQKIVNNLQNPNYVFNDESLMIYYYINEKTYTLNVDYDQIKSYLKIDMKTDNNLTYEDGYELDPNKTTVVLTFDDGPNGEKTKQIVDILEDYKMSATFFIVGNKILDNKDTVEYVNNSHSQMGYHSLNHTILTTQSRKKIKEEFSLSDTYFYNITGKHFTITRPPYGSYNTNVLLALNTPFIRWNIDTNDWKYKDVNHIVNEVMSKYKEGSIILCHDSYDTTVEATKEFIDKLYDANVQVVSIEDYISLRSINLENHKMYFNF